MYTGRSSLYLLIALLVSLLIHGCGENKTKAFVGLNDLETASIGAMTGSTGEQLVKARFPSANVKSFDDIMDAVAALKSNQLDAVVTGFPAAMNVCKHNADLVTIKEPVDYENTAIAMRKGEDELLTAVNRIIKRFHDDGTLKDMRRRWFKSDMLPYELVNINVPSKGEILKIGTSATREPFCFVDENNLITGHDGELARRISAELGRPIEFVDMKFSALIPALISKKVDLIVAGMTATEERMKSVNFSETYFKNSQVVIVKKIPGSHSADDTKIVKISSVEDIKDKNIGVLLGSVHDTYAMQHYPDAKIMQYKNPSELVLAVKSGKVDAAMYTTETLNEVLRENSDLQALGDTLFTVPIGMGFSKDNDKLREDFNTFLIKIKSDGTYDDMLRRWLREGSTSMPEVHGSKSSGILNVGIVSDKGMPFTVVKDNRLIGLDIELAERFAAYLGREVKFSDMEFGSLIVAAAAKKIDMIASTLIITDERKKQVDFSDPYSTLGANFFILKTRAADNPAGDPLSAQLSGGEATALPNTFFDDVAFSFYSNIIKENRYLLILDGLKITIIISILASLFGTLLGALVCFMRMSRKKLLLIPAKVYISILRGTPVLVVLMIIFYVVFASVDIDPVLVAVIAFGLNFAAYVSEMFRTGIESVDRGQTEAGIALGFTKIKTFINIVLPQAVRRILPVYKGEIISLVKMTSIVGYIAVQDLTKASDIIRSRTFDAFFPLIMVAVLYFVISWLLMVFLGYIERRTNPKLLSREA